MEMYKKIAYIFDKRQKRNLFILLIAIVIGAFAELLGVSGVLPLVTAITDVEALKNEQIFILVHKYTGITETRDFILLLLFVLIAIYLLKNIYITIMYDLQYRFTFHNQRRLSIKLMNAYISQDYLFHVAKNTAEIQRNVTSDVNMFFVTVQHSLQLLTEACVCLVLFLYLIITDGVLTISIVAIMSIFVLIFYKVYRKRMTYMGVRNRETQAEMYKWINQSFGGIKEVKVLNREKFFVDNYGNSVGEYTETQRKQQLLTTIPKPITETICVCGLLSVMAVKIWLGTDLKAFVPVISVFAVAAFRLLPSVNRVTSYMNIIMYNKSAVNSVYHDIRQVEGKLDERKYNQDNPIDLNLRQGIHIENISFAYPDTDKYILKDVSIEIPENKSVAFIGPSGAGKTTFADIILGILEPQKGKIQVGGVDIYENVYSWHKKLGYIPQNIYLMDDTIKNNIAFGIPEDEIDEDRIQRVIHDAQLTEFIEELEQGLETVIGERGVRLSGGQRQRIGIARALYGNPEILILDEATSALDNDTEKAVMDAIDSFRGNKTMIIIAHRLSTIRNCDLIYEVKEEQVSLVDKEKIF